MPTLGTDLSNAVFEPGSPGSDLLRVVMGWIVVLYCPIKLVSQGVAKSSAGFRGGQSSVEIIAPCAMHRRCRPPYLLTKTMLDQNFKPCESRQHNLCYRHSACLESGYISYVFDQGVTDTNNTRIE